MLNGENMFSSIIVGLLFVSVLASIIIIITRSSRPNNNSALNVKQVTGVVAVLSLTIAGFMLLYLYNFLLYRNILNAIFIVIELFSFIFWFYDPTLAIISNFFKSKGKNLPHKATPDKMNRYAVIGCAHNEQDVIERLIESVHKADYPRECYDLYIICDNCTDNTADVVRKAGAIAMERHDPDLRGKSHGLDWMFDILKGKCDNENNCYDAYVVLDADNLISGNFFKAMNRELNKGHEILQAYLGCKNPNDSWISRSYSVSYWITNFIYQRPHSTLGLSAQLGGTGMVFRPSVLEDIGWPTDTLTEDLMLTTRYVMKTNRAAAWVHEAQIYDEKPLKLHLSIKQRTRWMQGHMDCMFQNFGQMLKNAIVNRSMKQIDAAFYLTRPLLSLIMFVCYFIRWFSKFIFPSSILGTFRFIFNLPLAIALFAGYLLMQCVALHKEKFTKYIFWLPIQLIFSLTVYPAIFNGLIKHREKFWVSTKHTRAISIEQAAADSNVKSA